MALTGWQLLTLLSNVPLSRLLLILTFASLSLAAWTSLLPLWFGRGDLSAWMRISSLSRVQDSQSLAAQKKASLKDFRKILKALNISNFNGTEAPECFGQYRGYVDAMSKRRTLTYSKKRQASKKACWRILLIIVLNYPFYKIIPFLREIYAPAFKKNILFVTDENHPNHSDVFKTTLGYQHASGFYQHVAVSEVMRLRPDYDGYFFVSDDMAVDFYYLMATMDPDKIWTTTRGFTTSIVHPKDNIESWYHWTQPWGVPAFKKALRCLPPNTFERLKAESGCDTCILVRTSDIGYIPQRFVEKFRRNSYILRDTMNEFAIPNTLYSIAETRNDIQIIPGFYAYAQERLKLLDYLENENNMFVHAVKFSNETLQTYMKNWMQKRAAKKRQHVWKVCP